MKWHHWAQATDHPWVKQLVEKDGEDFEATHRFERRLFSPDGKQWPLVSVSTIIYVNVLYEEQRNLPTGFRAALECRKAAPMVRLYVTGKVKADDPWEEHSVGVPVGLVGQATEMLARAAAAVEEFVKARS